jgi:glycine cleavage system transcriptional repressor
MQLAISVLGKNASGFISELLSAVSACHCSILELNTSNLSKITTAFLLVDGNWNYVAKLENMLEVLRERYELQISLLRPEESPTPPVEAGVPYTLETISMDKRDLLFMVAGFLLDRGVFIEEISASLQPTMMFNNSVFSSRFLLLVPPTVRILSLREEFLDFCDSMNIDAILEPIKR